MKVIGLTGGIGTGKTTAAQYFIDKGFAHIDADQIAHELTADGMPMVDVFNELFGPDGPYGKKGVEILSEPGKLNRRAMASVAFSSEKRHDKLNEIMFEAITAEIEKQIEEIKSGKRTNPITGLKYPAILIDAPLLFESDANEFCDFVILLTADMDERINRVCLRDDVTSEEVKRRIDNQMNDELKEKLADFVIDNSGSIDSLYQRLDEVMEDVDF